MKTTRYVISFDIGDKRFYYIVSHYRKAPDVTDKIYDAKFFKKKHNAHNICEYLKMDAFGENKIFYCYEFKCDGIKYTLKDATNVRIRKVSVVVELDESEE